MSYATRAAALLFAASSLLQGGNAQCTIDPQYQLAVDPLFAIGEPLTVTATAPADQIAVLMLALGGTPTPSFFGTFCIGPEIYWAGMFTTTGSAQLIQWCRLKCDPAYLGARGYMQYIAFRTPGLDAWYISNPVNFGVTDQLGAAMDFNAFAVNDVAFDTGKTGGRIAAGKDVLLDNYQEGDDLANSQGARDDVIAGHDLNAKGSTVLNGNGVWVNQGSINNSQAPNGQFLKRASLPFTLADEALLLKRRWAQFAMLAVTGTNDPNGRVLTLTGTSTMMNVFMIDENELATKYTVIVNVPAGATAVVNITGTDLKVDTDLTVTGTQGCYVLWNFCEAKTIHFRDVTVDGTILAPCAAVTFDYGTLNGSLIAAYASGYGNCLNESRFCGCLQLSWP